MMTFFIVLLILVLIDFYVFQAVLTVSKGLSELSKSFVRIGFWVFTSVTFAAILWYAYGDPYKYGSQLRNLVLTGIFMIYFSKIFGVLFVLIDDLQRGVRWVADFFQRGATTPSEG
ncbi:MAG: metallophosphoesterase, partial [Cyclobacteriaceae bacterium]|nr:metallophosphoesterase [Cyclobacteriaceae bacterium]